MPNAAGTSLKRVRWKPSYRLVSSVFPPVGLFDEVADPDDLDVVFAIEGLTNPRLRQEMGQLSLVPPAERIAGPGATPVMAAFTHFNPVGSRFADGTYGVYYAAREVETAIAETLHHRERFLAHTATPPTEIDMRCYLANIDERLVDIRGKAAPSRDLYHPESYVASQAFAAGQRAAGARGIVYDSVRRKGGECVGLFWPRAVGPATQGAHYAFVWDGRRISQVYEKSNLRPATAIG